MIHWPRVCLMLLSVMLFSFLSSSSTAGEIRVAVASNFNAPMKALAKRFEKISGHNIVLAFSSSGKAFAQINNGAPFDAFLSADQQKPQRLVQGGLAVKGSQFTYAIGRLALWSPDTEQIHGGVDTLLKGNFQRVAIANPRHAPYGQAAIAVLKKLSLFDSLQSRLVQGENIAQTFQFVSSRNAQLGFIALSQVYRAGALTSGSAWLVPQTMHPPIRQDAVILTASQQKNIVREFFAYLKSNDTQELLQSYGYYLEPKA